MTPPAPTPEEEAAQRIDAVRGMVGEMRSGENWTLNRDAIMALLADHDLLLATAHARGRAEALEAAAQRVEALRFRPHEEEPNIVDSALNAAAVAIRALGGG